MFLLLLFIAHIFCLQSIKMFEETIGDGGKLIAVLCENFKDFDSGICCNHDTLAQMGENVDQTLRGKYYLNTKSSRPFALPKEISINCNRLQDISNQNV